MPQRIGYVCPRCGVVHSAAKYQESMFCRECGSFLRKRDPHSTQLLEQIQVQGTKMVGRGKFFPYQDFRPFQQDAIDFAFNVIRNGEIGLLSSPCGTGKSISILTAFFKARDLDNSIGKLVVLTRTQNQLAIYCRELKRIKRYSGVSFDASIFRNKMEMCPHIRQSLRSTHLSYRDFLQYCRNLRDRAFGKTCDYYDRMYRGDKLSSHAHDSVNRIRRIGPLLPEEVYRIGAGARLCPYEITNVIAEHAQVIVGNYNYVLADRVRNSLFSRANLRLDHVNCIFDEAHSLPTYATSLLSQELSSTSVRVAQQEIETYGLEDFGFLASLHDRMLKLGKAVCKESGDNTEHVIDKREILDPMMQDLGKNIETLSETATDLSELGESIQFRRAQAGRNPVSFLHGCATFFTRWTTTADHCYARYIKVEPGRSGKRRAKLGIQCLDPALASDVINKVRSSILMSGTLWNTEYYIDVLGIQRGRTEISELPSPFPRKNRLILIDTSVTTKFERRNEAQWERIADHIQRVTKRISGRVAIYFPSYAIMHKIAARSPFSLATITEERDTNIADLLRFMKSHKDCVILGVARGKISEGVDMSEEGRTLLSAVIIVGLPYPKRTELQTALVEYFRERFGKKAMEYAVTTPCLNALAQSAGRLLRSPEDRGIILIMDERAAGRLKNKFPMDWKADMEAYQNIETVLKIVQDFASTCVRNT